MTGGRSPWLNQVRTWQDAELNAAAWLRAWGYRDARAAMGGPDGGVDVRASGALAQVKFRASQIGRPDLQRLLGAATGTQAQLFFFTGTGYSRHAVEFADQTGIALFTYALDGSMTAINRVAHVVVQQRQSVNHLSPMQPSRSVMVNRRLSANSKTRALMLNWRAALGYLFLLILAGNVLNSKNYHGGSGTLGLIIAVIFLGALSFVCLTAHWRSPRGTWFPHRRS